MPLPALPEGEIMATADETPQEDSETDAALNFRRMVEIREVSNYGDECGTDSRER